MAKTDWNSRDTVRPEDMNQIGEQINQALAAISNTVLKSEVGQPEGVASLDDTGKVPLDQLPPIDAGVRSVNGKTGDVVLVAADVGAETPEGTQTKADTAKQEAIDWVKGYGLGATAVDISNTNLNTMRDTGFYFGTNLTNAPHSASGEYWSIICLRTWPNSGLQIAFDSTTKQMYTRHSSDSGWDSWIKAFTTEGGDFGYSPIIKPKIQAYTENYVVLGTSGAVNLDVSTSNVFSVTPTGTVTIGFTNLPSIGEGISSVTLVVRMGSTLRTVTFPNYVKWNDGAEPVFSTNTDTVLTFMRDMSNSNSWYGFISGVFTTST